MGQVFNENNTTVNYVVKAPGGGFQSIQFSTEPGSTETVGTKAFLVETATITFGRSVGLKYFTNEDNPMAILGKGSGTLSLDGMFGEKAAFDRLFGSPKEGCSAFTAKLITGKITQCANGSEKLVPITQFTMTGVIARDIVATNTIGDGGTMYTTARATFQITGLSTDTVEN